MAKLGAGWDGFGSSQESDPKIPGQFATKLTLCERF